MENKKETMSFVVVGYKSTVNDFIGKLKYRDFLSNLKFKERDQFEIKTNIAPQEINLEQFRNQFPVRIFESKNKEYVITYIFPEAKLIVEDTCFNSSKFEFVEKICNNIIDDNEIENINAVGVNFSVEYDLDFPLRLFNNQINKLTHWDRNLGFSISLPLEIDKTIIANYKIEKIKERSEINKKIRTYQTFVNYNFDLKDNDNFKIVEIFDKSKNFLYDLFNKNQEAIRQIGQIDND